MLYKSNVVTRLGMVSVATLVTCERACIVERAIFSFFSNLQEMQCFEWLELILDPKHYLNLKHWLYINFQTTNRLMHKIWHKIVMQGEQFMVSSKMGVPLHISTKVLMCPSSSTKFLNTKPPPQPNKPTLNSPNLKLSSIDEVAYCLLKK